MCGKSLQLCPALCNAIDHSPPGSSVCGILQAGILEWLGIPCSRESSQPKDWACISYISSVGRWVLLPLAPPGKPPPFPFLLQFSSVAQSCLTLNRSTPGLPFHHHLPEFTQTHIHRVGDAIQPSHPLSSPVPPSPNPSQHQSLFQWVNSSHEVAKVLEFQLKHHSFQRTSRADLL